MRGQDGDSEGAGGDNEAARRRNLSERASSKRQKTRIRLYLLLFYPVLSLQETNLDLSSHHDCDSPPLWPLLLRFKMQSTGVIFPPGQHVDINIRRRANIQGA